MSRVLLVADASWVLNEVASSLTLGDWEIEANDDPRETTGLISERDIDAVIVDMQVGSMGGMAVIRDIRQTFQDEERPHTVLLLDRSADQFLARRAGADSCVMKPITASELREALGPGVKTEPLETKPTRRNRKAAPKAQPGA